ncbi:MAG: methyltransferase domain-containing protein [Pseudoxanthomonas sp.]
MPVPPAQHTPVAASPAMDWFGSAAGVPVLAAERERIAAELEGRAPQPWLWLTPLATDAVELPPRGMRLHRDATGLAGTIRCGLPLPLPSESFGVVVVQHMLDDGRLPDLLAEAERILQPGGCLRLFALNPFSPWRLHWRGTGLQARTSAAWRARLRAAGFHVDPDQVEWLGPAWREAGTAQLPQMLRAACLIGAEKRIAPLTPARPASTWRPDAAPAGY